MNTEKHTPGPWQNEKSGFFSRPFTSYVAARDMKQNDGWCVATVHGPEHEANARLIAAAPDLLAVLLELCADKYLADPINADRMANARTAIAKAEGNA